MEQLDEIKHYLLAHQGEHITLEELSDWAKVSKFHLQREFKRQVGISPFQYLERARLRKAASSLVIQDDTVLNIALGHGYRSHETFTRAFQRHFDMSPRTYRISGRLLSSGVPPERASKSLPFGSWQLSKSRVQKTRDLFIKSTRRLGPYEQVPPSLWAEVQGECQSQGMSHGALVGLGWDNPQTCPPDQLRFDAGVIVRDQAQANQILPAQHWAVTLYTGSFAALGEAYRQIAQQAAQLPNVRFLENPILEVYHADDMEVEEPTRYLEVFIPVVLLDEEI